MLTGTVGGVLFLGVGIVSARAARRRLRYETWFHLHLYTYLAIALAFSHQFADGAEFVDNLPARILWSALYLSVAGAVAWYRFLVPVRQALRHRMRVEAVHQEAPGVVSILITGARMAELEAEAGQFLRCRFLTRELWWASNPYSLSATPRGDRLRVTVKDLGEHSGALARLRPGTKVFTEGPYGAMTAGRRRHRKVLLVAGGIGITPLRALFKSVPADELTLLYRSSRDADVVFADELAQIGADRGARVHHLVGSRAELGHDPLSAGVLVANIPDLREHDVFVCGPPPMTSSALAALRTAGVPRRQIHREDFQL